MMKTLCEMTMAELDELPELSEMQVMWRNEDDPIRYVDAADHEWELGYVNGIAYKQRIFL